MTVDLVAHGGPRRRRWYRRAAVRASSLVSWVLAMVRCPRTPVVNSCSWTSRVCLVAALRTARGRHRHRSRRTNFRPPCDAQPAGGAWVLGRGSSPRRAPGGGRSRDICPGSSSWHESRMSGIIPSSANCSSDLAARGRDRSAFISCSARSGRWLSSGMPPPTRPLTLAAGQ
jgi:hypothetical protein